MPFLVFEGLDGAGKSTLIDGLRQALVSQSQASICVTREPGGTPLGDEIRALLLRQSDEPPTPLTELLLYEAVRAQNVDRVIRPALARQAWVLCDRYVASSVAFQAGGRGLPISLVDELNKMATGGLLPDLTLLIDLPVPESLRRLGGRQKDRFESEAVSFHERVRQAFLDQAQREAERWLVLDGQLPPETLLQAVLTELRRRGWLAS